MKKSEIYSSDNCQQHGQLEIEEPSQLQSSEIPKQDIYQEISAKAVLIATSDSSAKSVTPINVDPCGSGETIQNKSKICEQMDTKSDTWYYIDIPYIPLCTEKSQRNA